MEILSDETAPCLLSNLVLQLATMKIPEMQMGNERTIEHAYDEGIGKAEDICEAFFTALTGHILR